MLKNYSIQKFLNPSLEDVKTTASFLHAIEKIINDLKLNNKVTLLGFQLNHFPYIKNDKAFILSSNFENQPVSMFLDLC